ncbi:MAG: hypothetical protein AAGH87_03905 [Pseudomonadota bacterium]
MRVLVVGAGRPLGAKIAVALGQAGHQVTATRFRAAEHDAALVRVGAALSRLDARDTDAVSALAADHDAAVLTPMLTTALPAALTLAQAGLARGVVFSSHNVSAAPAGPVYPALAGAEAALLQAAPGWIALRPTMIYGHRERDALAGLLRRAARWPALPRPGSGAALQQPIHVDDLARLASALATGAGPGGGRLAIGGPDTLSQTALLEAVYAALGRRPQVIALPLAPVRWAARVAATLGMPLPLDRHQIARIERDKHVAEPADLPADLMPRTALADGLARLAADIGLIPAGPEADAASSRPTGSAPQRPPKGTPR